jgi:hypothetical protein
MSDALDRRNFLKTAALAGAGLALDPTGGIARRSAPQEFPDFTRGRWRTRPHLDLGERRAG